ncbi:MAG: hypothetical protein AB7O24_26165 [Kofleriaceae bacterium]
MVVSDWDYRELCSDGGCIGIIGPDGTCKVCGRAAPNWGDERRRGLVAAEATASTDATLESPATSPSTTSTIGGWTDRQLCSDGSCIGVIGDTGRCKVCGRAASAGPPAAHENDRDDEDFDDDEGDEGFEDDEQDFEDDDADVDGDGDVDGDDRALSAAADELAQVAPLAEVDSPRTLCPDGACVGVIGTNGRCKLCGKAAA